jgi:hypothetical protein
MSRHIRMGGIDLDVGEAAFDDRLADAFSHHEHLLCLCPGGRRADVSRGLETAIS